MREGRAPALKRSITPLGRGLGLAAWGLLLLLSLRGAGATAAAATNPRLVLFVLDRVTLPDVLAARAPALHGLLAQGAVGLMNTTSAEGRTAAGSHATLSAGIVAMPPDEIGQCFGGREPFENGPAVDVYLRRTGRRASPSAVLHLGIAPLFRVNQEHLTGATPGALGDLLSQAGPTGAIGNGDGDPYEPPLRLAPNVIIRRSGVIDRGDISPDLLTRYPTAPFGRAQDPRKLLAAYRRYAPRCTTLLVDLGETARVELYRPYLPREVVRAHRLRAIERADRLVGALLPAINPARTRIVLLCPFPALSEEGRVANLGFFALPSERRGVLTSGTTRTPGLVANVDVLPTLGRLLGLPPPGGPDVPMLTGSPMRAIPSADPLGELERMDRMVQVNRGIAAGGGVVATASVLGFLGALAIAFWWTRGSRPGPLPLGLTRFALLGALAFPAVLALVPAFRPATLLAYFALLVPLWLGVGLLLLSLQPRLSLIAGFLGLTLFMTWDLLRGGHLLAFSILSDFAIVGTRFHGLANEYMGAFVGASLMGALLLWERRGGLAVRDEAGRRPDWWVLAAWFVLCTLVVGWPTLGDNAGGVPTAVFAYGAAWLLLRRGRLSWQALAGMGALVGLTLAALSMVDGLSGQPTHLGRTALLVRDQGWGYVGQVALRKLAMNWAFATDPRALWTYAGAAVLLLLWFWRGRDTSLGVLDRRPVLKVAGVSSLVGAAAAFAFNDTGMLPAVLVIAAFTLALATALWEEVARRPEWGMPPAGGPPHPSPAGAD